MKETNIIYESANGGNVIVQVGNEYFLINQSGATVQFDGGEKILQAVIENIEKYGNLYFHKNNSNGWYWIDETKRPVLTLTQLIWAVHKNVPVTKIKGQKRIKLRDGNPCNLTSDNLYVSETQVIKHQDNIYLYNEEHRKIAVANYSDELYEILNTFELYYNRKKDYFSCNLNGKLIDIEYLCWAHYKYNADKSNVDEIIGKVKKEFINHSPKDRAKQLVIDHKNSLHWCNKSWNLQLVEHGLNVKKGNLTSKLKPNQFYMPLSIDENSGAGEATGRINYKTDMFGTLYFLLTKEPAYDIEFLPHEADNEKRVGNLVTMIRKDEMPEEKITIPMSNLQYFYLILKGLTWISKEYKNTQTKNKIEESIH